MKFHYTASNKEGKLTEGDVEAQSVAEVLEYLLAKSLKPLSLKKEDFFVANKRKFGILQGSIGMGDKIFLIKYLALMVKTGADLFKAIDILIMDTEKIALKSFLYEIRENLEKGQPFFKAFANHPRYFSSVFVNLIRGGEVAGNLEKTFNDLSQGLIKEQNLKQEIRSALIYPIILIVVAMLIVFFIVSFALPKISRLFSDSGFSPPLFSKIVFSIGAFLNSNFLPIIFSIFVIVILSFIFIRKSSAVKVFFQRLIRRLPLIGPLLKKIAIQRFASTLGALLSAGLPLLEALNITAQTVGDEELKNAILRISKEGISKGLTIGDAFKRETAFPRVIVNLIAISEKSGNLSDILSTLSDFYETEIKTSIKTLITLLEPILLLFIGAIIGIIALAILVPIYQLVGSFR